MYKIINGDNSVLSGCRVIQTSKVYVTKRSKNLLSEIKTYVWKTDNNCLILEGFPVKVHDHACDAMRYGIYTANKGYAKKWQT